MSWARLAATAVGIASTIVACGKYGSEDEPTIVPIDGGGRSDGSNGNDVLVPEDNGAGSADADAALPTIDCLGVPRPAFFCDGFEGTAFDPAWTKVVAPMNDARPDISLTTQKAIAGGARSAYLGFSTLPTNGVSMLRWSRGTKPAGPLTLQWSVFWPKDGFDVDQVFPIGALRSADARVATVSIRITGIDAAGDLLLTIGAGEPINLGAITPNTWSCIELAHDGTNLTAYRGDTAQVKRALSSAIDAVEVGYEWPYPENGGAGAGLYVDDVIVSPVRLGCIH